MAVNKQDIVNYSKEIGIDIIGFTNDNCLELKEKLLLQQNLGYSCGFEKGTIDERINPKRLLDDLNTIIVIGMGYPKTDVKLKNINVNEVYFSSSSWGTDYHKVLKDKLTLLAEYLNKKNANFNYKIAVDTSILDDRYMAYKAGLGFYGKNGLLINDDLGSYFFIGCLLTNLYIEIDKPLNMSCYQCDKCTNICPNHAINDSGILNAKKCLSYITQKKEQLTADETILMNDCIYGCDLCQQACPYNDNINNTHHKDFKLSGIEFINVNEYKDLSNKEFNVKYGSLAGSWRGKNCIQRNIKIYKEKIAKKD
jgi:epoxyqueuosine reductase